MSDLEEWRFIDDYPRYMISNLGRVKSIDEYITVTNSHRTCTSLYKGRVLTPKINRKGYCRIMLYKRADKTYKNFYIHRLVAKYFLAERPSEAHEINHINRIRNDNRAVNIEWCTKSENELHKNIIKKPRQKIKQVNKLDMSGVLIRTYNNARDAAFSLGCESKYANSSILRVCHGIQNSAYGFKWEFNKI